MAVAGALESQHASDDGERGNAEQNEPVNGRVKQRIPVIVVCYQRKNCAQQNQTEARLSSIPRLQDRSLDVDYPQQTSGSEFQYNRIDVVSDYKTGRVEHDAA